MIVKHLAAVTILAASLLLISSCKENTLMNADALPQADQLDVNALPDTLTILTKTIFDDSLNTSAHAISGATAIAAIGKLNDHPVINTDMGSTEASTFLQFAAPATSYVLDTSKFVFDSVVMVLPYSGFTYGDTTATAPDLKYSVYRLNQSLSLDSTYYSNHPGIAYNPTLLGEKTVPVRQLNQLFKDSIAVNGKKEIYHLRIPLAQQLLDTLIAKTNSNPAGTQPDFVSWLKGFYITSDNSSTQSRSIPYWRISGTGGGIYDVAGLVVYYHTKGSNDTLVDAFSYNGSFTTQFNKVKRNFSPGTLAAHLLSSVLPSDSLVFVNNEPGGALDIKIPFAKFLPKGVINKAELIITESPAHVHPLFSTPARLYPYAVDEFGNNLVIADRLPVSSEGSLNFIDGIRKIVLADGQVVSQYKINIPRELQRAIREQRDTLHLRINGTVTFPGAYRLVAAGRNHSNQNLRIKMNIVYSQLN